MAEKHKKCILLVRVSTERQSLEAQEKELYELAKRYGYDKKHIIAIPVKESGIKLDESERLGLNKMKEYIEKGDVDCVFAWEISRIARRQKVLYSIRDYLIEKRVQLIIKEPNLITLLNSDYTLNDSASLIFTLYAELAESEMRNKFARFKRAKRELFDKGRYMGGKYLLGYTVDEQGFWQVDETSAKIVRLMFEMYNTGRYSLTDMAKELQSLGYFLNHSITNLKAEIYHWLKNPIYKGVRTNNNLFPRIIDDETWNKCEQRRKEHREHFQRWETHLLTPLIRCKCGASYSANLIDATYTCRVKHNAVEKGLEHSPDININMAESLAWYVALQELSKDKSTSIEDVKKRFEDDINKYEQKKSAAETKLDRIKKRLKKLNDDYYVNGADFDEKDFADLRKKIADQIEEQREVIISMDSNIKNIQKQISQKLTFDQLLDSLPKDNDSLKNGLELSKMKEIVFRYITEIKIETIEGKATSVYKKVSFRTIYDEEKEKERKELEKKGLTEFAIALTNVFYVHTIRKKAYFDEEMTVEVPMVYLERVKRTRVDSRVWAERKRKRLESKAENDVTKT